MKKCMLDTNIISAILKGNERVITYAENYLKNDGANTKSLCE
jgi:predicted nucleic acid-binding protein